MADTPRLFIGHDLAAGEMVAATPGQAHYLGNVMRRGVGDAVRVFNGRDGEWAAEIATLKKDRASFRPTHRTRPQDPASDLWLVFALLKRDATDLVVQKATELGVSALLPVTTERTNASRPNRDRLLAIATEAAEQSERLSVPDIHQPTPLFDLLGGWPASRILVAAIERQPQARPWPGGAGALLVGPEGGFSPRELEALGKNPFIWPVSLGPRILRAETAAIAGLALLQGQGWQPA